MAVFAYDVVKEYKKLFPEDFMKSYPFQLGGYLLYRKADGAYWGSSDKIAYFLFGRREDAEAVLRMIDYDGGWEVKQYGLSELDSEKWKTSQDLGE